MGESPESADQTARARIRDAALLQFAEHGVKGATFKGIAEAAGVSVGLIQHHFGSKEALREACDAYALDLVMDASANTTVDGLRDPDVSRAIMRATMPVRRYLARALVDGSAAAARLFDDLVAHTERYLADPPPGIAPPNTADPHAYAVAVVAMKVGVAVLHEHVSRALGVDTLAPEGLPRLALAMLEVFDDRLLSPEAVETARKVLAEAVAESPIPDSSPPPGENDA